MKKAFVYYLDGSKKVHENVTSLVCGPLSCTIYFDSGVRLYLNYKDDCVETVVLQ